MISYRQVQKERKATNYCLVARYGPRTQLPAQGVKFAQMSKWKINIIVRSHRVVKQHVILFHFISIHFIALQFNALLLNDMHTSLKRFEEMKKRIHVSLNTFWNTEALSNSPSEEPSDRKTLSRDNSQPSTRISVPSFAFFLSILPRCLKFRVPRPSLCLNFSPLKFLCPILSSLSLSLFVCVPASLSALCSSACP